MSPRPPPVEAADAPGLLEAFRFTPRALGLVWTTSARLCLWLGGLSLLAGVLPAGIAWAGKLIVDAVVAGTRGGTDARDALLLAVALALALGVAQLAVQQGLLLARQLLRAQLGFRVNRMILEKALELDLSQFEDSEFYDKLTRSRREASVRPMAIAHRTFQLIQDGLTLAGLSSLLLVFSGWAIAVLFLAALPSFLAETRFSGEAFRLFRWQTPETRRQNYLEVVLAREDYAKEVKVFGLGPRLLEKYEAIYHRIYAADRDLAVRRAGAVLALELLSAAVFYGVHLWVALETLQGRLTIGEMTMVVLVFKQGRGSFSAILQSIGGMVEDNLYLSTLYEFLDARAPELPGSASEGPRPGDGIRFEGVCFSYPGADHPAIHELTLHLPPGRKLALVGPNGSGKTTLIKLLTRLYTPSRGRILLDGLDLREWDPAVLRRRVGVIFQDFARYQFLLGENIGAGDAEGFEDRDRWQRAAEKGMVTDFMGSFPDGFETQLGRWFRGGRELSVGQWQKVALARAFMREGADILVLDEPTASMDAEAELQIFERFREMTGEKMAVLISHRFSTVRMADHIVVLEAGHIHEEGSHEELMRLGGRYAHLFSLQAAAFADGPGTAQAAG